MTKRAKKAKQPMPPTFDERVYEYEAHLIRVALRRAHGHVETAAGLLGMTRQRLAAMLESRHSELYEMRQPVRVRHKSLIPPHLRRPVKKRQPGRAKK